MTDWLLTGLSRLRLIRIDKWLRRRRDSAELCNVLLEVSPGGLARQFPLPPFRDPSKCRGPRDET
jgi:hypothetical protein